MLCMPAPFPVSLSLMHLVRPQPSIYVHGLQMLVGLPSSVPSQTRARSAPEAGSSLNLDPSCWGWSSPCPIGHIPSLMRWESSKQGPGSNWAEVVSVGRLLFPDLPGSLHPRHPAVRGQCLRDSYLCPIRISQARASPFQTFISLHPKMGLMG